MPKIQFPQLVLVFFLAAIFLAGCSRPALETAAPVDGKGGSTLHAQPAEIEPTALPDAVEVSAQELDACVVCHTDKQMLIDTAKVEEAAEAESKGVG